MGTALSKIANAFGHADQAVRDQFEGMILNLASSRERFFRKFFHDSRRDIDKECGYPDTMSADEYRRLYERESVAARVVEIFPKESWKNPPYIFEDENPEVETEFEKALKELDKSLGEESWNTNDDAIGSPINEALQRVDELSGIGSFGILLLGLDDGKALSEPVDGLDEFGRSTRTATENELSPAFRELYELGVGAQYRRPELVPPRPTKEAGRPKLIYLKAYDESLVRILEYESRQQSPRYGKPVLYQVTLNDPDLTQQGGAGLEVGTADVHWTRVVHVADNRMSSDVFGVPRMQQVLNHLLNLRKLYGGSAEMYWRGAFPGYSLETHPNLAPRDVDIDTGAIKDAMEQYMNGLQRYFWSAGLTAKSLAPQVVDPTPQIDTQIEAICIKLGVPKRKFLGSERGELASSDDEGDWSKKIMGRKRQYLIPHVVVPFFDRLIAIGVLPAPKQYKVDWPDTDILTQKEKIGLAEAVTRTLALYVQQEVATVIPPQDYLPSIGLGFTEAQAKMFIKHAEEYEEEQQEKDMKLMEEQQKLLGGPEGAGKLPFDQGMPQPGKQTRDSAKPGEGPANPKEQKAATKDKKGPTKKERPAT